MVAGGRAQPRPGPGAPRSSSTPATSSTPSRTRSRSAWPSWATRRPRTRRHAPRCSSPMPGQAVKEEARRGARAATDRRTPADPRRTGCPAGRRRPGRPGSGRCRRCSRRAVAAATTTSSTPSSTRVEAAMTRLPEEPDRAASAGTDSEGRRSPPGEEPHQPGPPLRPQATADEARPDAAGPASAADEHAAAVRELEDRWRRALADLDNLRKRHARELERERMVERSRTAAAFLPVLDNLELALSHADADSGRGRGGRPGSPRPSGGRSRTARLPAACGDRSGLRPGPPRGGQRGR